MCATSLVFIVCRSMGCFMSVDCFFASSLSSFNGYRNLLLSLFTSGGCGGFFFDGINCMLGECCLSSCCSVSMQQQQQLRYHFQLALGHHLSNQVHSKTNNDQPLLFFFSYKRLLSGSTTMDILRKKSSYIGHKGNS